MVFHDVSEAYRIREERRVAIARSLQLRTVAEGVETEAQTRVLRALGCSLHRGYLYSRPLPAAEFERLYI